jgi:hypothetical protein
VGIRAIEYRPWKGERTDPNRRWLVISWHVFRKNIRSPAVIVLLIFGMMLAHAFPIIGAILFPHEELTDEDMVGRESVFVEGTDPIYDFNVTDGDLNFTGDIRVNGNVTIIGELFLTGSFTLNGTVAGIGALTGGDGQTVMTGAVLTFPEVYVSGYLSIGNLSNLKLGDIPDGFPGDPPEDPPGGGEVDPEAMILALLMSLDNATIITGEGTISGFGSIWGNGTVDGDFTPGGSDEPIIMGSGGYLSNGVFILFTMLLAAIICADIISADLANSSFVLYFSRPVRTIDYLVGKSVGLMWVMWVFSLLPPIVYVLVMMGTQSGDDFSNGLKVLGKTFLAGFITAIYFLPYGLMISSFTKSKAYAGIGIFMSFFVLSIISEIFADTSDKWTLIDPFQLLFNFYKILFNGSIPEGIQASWVGAAIAGFIIVPAVVTYFWVNRKGAGK